MRQFLSLPLFVALGFWPGSLLALDCTALAGTDIPFAITSDVTTRRAGEAPTTRTQQTQVVRKGRELVTYTVDSPAINLRTRGFNPLFPVDAFYSTEANDPPKWTYSVDPAVDPLTVGEPLRYGANMKSADGKLQLTALMTLEVVETGSRELGGCRFEVVKIRRTLDGLADGQPVSNSGEVWIAPALRAVIGSILRTGTVEVTSTATAISVGFKPLE